MADPQDQPQRGAAGIPPPPRKAPATKAPTKKAPTNATASVQRADNPAVLRSTPAGDYRLPISLGLAAAGLVALVLSRLRRG
jgi:hypothetical protein